MAQTTQMSFGMHQQNGKKKFRVSTGFPAWGFPKLRNLETQPLSTIQYSSLI